MISSSSVSPVKPRPFTSAVDYLSQGHKTPALSVAAVQPLDFGKRPPVDVPPPALDRRPDPWDVGFVCFLLGYGLGVVTHFL